MIHQGVLTLEALEEVVAAYMQFDAFVIDLETKGVDRLNPLTNEVFWISLAGPGRADVIPCGHPVGRLIAPAGKEKRKNPDTGRMKTYPVPALFGPPPEQLWISEVTQALRPLLFSDSRKIGHNIKFDMKSLAKYYGGEIPPGPYGDTQILARLVEENHQGNRPYALDNCVRREFGFSYEKIGKNVDEYPFDAALTYSHLDAKYCWLLWQRYLRQLRYEGVENIWEWLEEPVLRVVMEMEMAGAPVSRRRLERFGDTLAKEMAEIFVRLDTLWRQHHEQEGTEKCPRCGALPGAAFNPDADRQVGELVYDIRNHRCYNYTLKTQQRQVNRDSLERYEKDPYVADVLRWSELAKLKSSFVDSLLPRIEKGRIHGQFNQLGTVTGRFSSSEPNLQQIPVRSEDGSKVRECFVAPRGHKLIIADFSQIELRVLAHFSRDPLLLRAYKEELDLHSITARAAYHIAEDAEVSKEQRSLAKNVNFSVIYSVGPSTLVTRYKVPSVREAKHLIETFYKTYRQVKPWQRYELNKARSRYKKSPYVPPHVLTILGRKRRLPQLFWSDDEARMKAERQAINTIIQGSAGDMNKLALVCLRQALIDAGMETKMILSVHDEVGLITPDDEAEEALALTKKTMENLHHPTTGKPLLRVPVVVDAKLAETWAEK